MALFNGVDRDLPLLTQVFQLDDSSEAEMIEFHARQYGSIDVLTTLDVELERPTTLERIRSGEDLVLLQTFIRITRKVMMIWAICPGKIPAGEWHILHNWYTLCSGFALTGLPDANGLIDIRTQVVRHSIKIKDLATDLIPRIVRELWDFVHGDAQQLCLCQECKSLYVHLRKGQQWCSNRCSNRVGERRRRQKKGILTHGVENSHK